MNQKTNESEIEDSRQKYSYAIKELTILFGEDIVNQAQMIDVVDLNLNDEMTRCISNGVKNLKNLRNQPESQMETIRGMSPGERILVCMWIMEMNLLEKLQSESYVKN